MSCARNQELQQMAERYHGLRWRFYDVAGSKVRLLHQDEGKHQILVMCRYGRHEDFRVQVLPAGIWQIATKPAGWDMDLKVIDRCLGLRDGTSRSMYDRDRTRHAMKDEGPYKMPGYSWNQWTRLDYSNTTFDYHDYFKTARAELPEYMHRGIWKFIKKQRYDATRSRVAFDWSQAYSPADVSSINTYFEKMAKTHDYMDNFRVAKVGARQHHHHYHRRKESGCCGQHDEVIEVRGTQYHVGFNYGH